MGELATTSIAANTDNKTEERTIEEEEHSRALVPPIDENQRKDQRNESEVKNTEHHNLGQTALDDQNNAKPIEEEPEEGVEALKWEVDNGKKEEEEGEGKEEGGE